MDEIFANIFDKLATKAYREVVLAWGLNDEMERLQNSMQFVSAFLVDADNKKAGNHSIAVWLRQLRAAFLDAEDVLDEIECEALRKQVVKMHGNATRKVRRFFSSSNPLVFRIIMGHKIKHVKERIDEITSERESYGLIKLPLNNVPLNPREMPLRETHSHLDKSLVIGRDDEKEELISFLKSSQAYHEKISVTSIVGIGGLGKTTLAKLVYKDERIVEHFESRIWVCVSNDFDVKRLIFEILKEMGRQNLGALNFNQLQSLLREEFPKKKHLLVLDDVWNEDRKKWVELSNALLGDGRGQNDSKIIVTTRSEMVSSIMGTAHQHKLKELSKDESWKLFVKWAFLEGEEEKQPRLKEIGKHIIKKCRGVPLAVVTIASMLYSHRDVREWEKVKDSEIWQMDEQNVDILPVLRLSYHHLSFHVKQCFSYCSIFPKDCLFFDYKLIYFWMAHGLLQSSNENEDIEHIGMLYLKELISRCFLQIEDTIFGFYVLKMHDLVHDLAMSTMQSEVAVMSHSSLATNANKNIRHLSILSNDKQVSACKDKMPKNIRTIEFFNQTFKKATVTELFKWISNTFKYLRVLDVQNCNLESLPDCFRKMKQLRYLDLGGNKLIKIPDSIWTQQNLLYLDMVGCPLYDLPKDMRNLISLRYLGLTTNASSLSHIGLGCFKYLYILVIRHCDNLISLTYDLAQLSSLRKLIIMDCRKIVNFQEKEEDKEDIAGIHDLSLEYFMVFGCGSLESLPSWLQRAKNLQYMFIVSCKGLEVLPEWLPKLRSLEELEIRGCPQLSKRCRQESSPDWPKIAHIPKLTIL